MAEQHARDIERHNIKKRAAEEEERKKQLQSKTYTAELPGLAEYGSREAFGLMNDLAQRKADMQLQKLQEQKDIAVKQVELLTTIKDNTAKPQMGMVK
jgi:K+-transporting ATPase c subunit